MTPQELEQSQRRSWLINLHRTIAKPYMFVRRRAYKKLKASGKLLPEGSK